MEWTPELFVLATGAILTGSLLQAATGLGAGLIIVPLLALISYDLVPAPMIFASIALSSTMAFRGREAIDKKGLGTITAGLILGTILAAVFIANIPIAKLGIVFGVIILLAVGVSLFRPAIRFEPRLLLATGFISGIMGTAAGIGAPVLALLYQYHPAATVRATLAFLYLISSLMMLFFLHFAGRFGLPELISGLFLIPGFILGYLLSPALARLVDHGYIRPIVLIFSSVSALLLIAKSF